MCLQCAIWKMCMCHKKATQIMFSSEIFLAAELIEWVFFLQTSRHGDKFGVCDTKKTQIKDYLGYCCNHFGKKMSCPRIFQFHLPWFHHVYTLYWLLPPTLNKISKCPSLVNPRTQITLIYCVKQTIQNRCHRRARLHWRTDLFRFSTSRSKSSSRTWASTLSALSASTATTGSSPC